MPKVIVRKEEYDSPTLPVTVSGMLEDLLSAYALKGMNILVKPNLLMAAPPEKAITTHPLLIRNVSSWLLDQGANVTIADSPGRDSFNRIIDVCGIRRSLAGLSVKIEEFMDKTTVKTDLNFKNLELASSAVDADLIVNLPKLKTHSQMLLTLCVKNLFGCVVGMQKPQWHFRTGADLDMFAKLLIQIYLNLKPSVTILDGILAMEGQGPGTRGTPRHLGIIMGSEDAIALDHLVAQMLKIDPLTVPVLKAANDLGILKEADADGSLPEVVGFRLPGTKDLRFGPRYLHRFFRKHITRRPLEERDKCLMCLECASHCPVTAIEEKRGRLHFDYDKCIRC
ncbi:MAG: DUF362 domain-containing protein, partial [Nitrospirota bacterium]